MDLRLYRRVPRPLTGRWLVLLAVWLLVSLAGAWKAAGIADRLEQQAEANMVARAAVAAEAIEQVLTRLLDATETLHDLAQARLTAQEVGEPGIARAIEAQLSTVALRERFGILQVAIIDPDGWLSWSSVPDWERVDLGDREHFRVHRSGDHGLFVSEPLIGRASGRHSVQFTRRLSNTAGAFAGVAVVSVDAQQLSDDLSSMEFGEGAAAVIIRRDGVTLAHSRLSERALRVRLQPENPFLQAIKEARSGYIRVPQSSYDGRAKLVFFRVAPQAPVAVAAALDTEIELASIGFARPLFLGVAAAISALSLLALALALLWLDRRRTQLILDTTRREREAALEELAHTQRVEALGRLAGGVAHDFNNVLQAVLGGAKGISRRSSDPSIQRLAQMISDAAGRGASVARRLLTFARRDELRTERVQLPDVLVGIQEVLTHTLGAGIEVKIEAPDALPSALTDRSQLETVLVNLAINARDAMTPLGGGTLTISAAPVAISDEKASIHGLPAGEYLRLVVSDTGTGMDAATLARAGEPFFTTKSETNGTGLGLAMAKSFAAKSGGALRIESERGAGTRVILWLPRAEPRSDVEVSAETTRSPDPGARPAAAQRVQVLLVDDEALIRNALMEELGALGWNVSVAASGAAAMAHLETGEALDLLVTDLAMPRMDGLSLIREVRRRRPGLPALLLTGHAGAAHTAMLAAVAADGPFALLRKPVDAEEVFSIGEMLVHDRAVRGPELCPPRASQAA